MRLHYLILSLLISLSLPVLPTATAHNNVQHVYVGVVEGENRYNITQINLEKNTEYHIFFVNPYDEPHNLRIDIDGLQILPRDLKLSQTNDPDDILIGEPNNDPAGANGIWNTTWVTPNYDLTVTYYCGYDEHFPEMKGQFFIGDLDQDYGLTWTSDTTSSSIEKSPIQWLIWPIFLLGVSLRTYKRDRKYTDKPE